MVTVTAVVYGYKMIQSQSVKDAIRHQIESHGSFTPTNDTIGEDPDPGKKKEFSVQWWANERGPTMQIDCSEGETVNFRVYVKEVYYGGELVQGRPNVYAALNRVLSKRGAYNEARKWSPFAGMKSQDQVTLGNGFFGFDPQPNQKKQVNVRLEYAPDIDADYSNFSYEEGDKFPPRDVDPDQYIDDNLASEGLATAASSMMSAGNSYR